jgi:tRNA pseudouridine synthase 10
MKNVFDDKKIIKIAEKTLSKYNLCNHCLGRIFAKKETGLTNNKRGELIRKNIKKSKKVEVKNCWLCSGLLNEINHFVNLIYDSLSEYEYDTFLIGTKVDEDILEKEKKLYEFTGDEHTESIKTELNREIGKILEKKLNKEVDFKNPTIMIIIDTTFDDIKLQILSLFIYGRYKKFKRDISQTIWFCKICSGKGCKKCNFTGKLYNESVEGLISNLFLKETKGNSESFHGSGREDIDVRMLGNGRPFILEIKNPKIRNIDLLKIERNINKNNKSKIEISKLRFTNRDEIVRIKNSKFKKTYKIIFEMEKSLNKEKLKKAAQSLRDINIGQFTPLRVAHRRANMIREKHIYDCNVESINGKRATLIIKAESGTYIKELITGDNGRTKPSISELIGIPCEVKELDVIEVKGE